jgi:hypothetical protein
MMMMQSVKQQGGIPTPPRVDNDFAALTAYFGREMALGRITRGDPTVPALALMHATSGFAMSQLMQPATVLFDASGFLKDFVSVIWQGLEPKERGG